MGQRMSISQEDENELFNLFQLYRNQAIQQGSQVRPVARMRMMAPTAIGVKTQVAESPARVRRTPIRQAQQFGRQY
jgi:hypothetical protein